MLHTFTVHSL